MSYQAGPDVFSGGYITGQPSGIGTLPSAALEMGGRENTHHAETPPRKPSVRRPLKNH